PGDEDQRAADEPEPCRPLRYQPGSIHQVAENQPVPQADDPARAEQERPVLDRRERVGNGSFRRTRALLSQGDDRDHRDDADEDERALEQTRGHVADRQLLVAPPHDRNDHHRGADVGDDQQQLQKRAEQNLLVMPAARDVAHRMPKHGLVKHERRNRRNEGREIEHAKPARPLLIYRHLPAPLSPGRWQRSIPRPPVRLCRTYAPQTALTTGRRTHLFKLETLGFARLLRRCPSTPAGSLVGSPRQFQASSAKLAVCMKSSWQERAQRRPSSRCLASSCFWRPSFLSSPACHSRPTGSTHEPQTRTSSLSAVRRNPAVEVLRGRDPEPEALFRYVGSVEHRRTTRTRLSDRNRQHITPAPAQPTRRPRGIGRTNSSNPISDSRRVELEVVYLATLAWGQHLL